MKQITALLVLGCFFGAGVFAGDDNWPQFRGPGARGIAEGNKQPDRWSPTENVAWKTDLPGRGWSSPIVWGDKIFLTATVNLGVTEPAKKGLYFGGERKDPPKTEHQWKVFCLDLKSGKIVWEKNRKKRPAFQLGSHKKQLRFRNPGNRRREGLLRFWQHRPVRL